MTSPIKTLSPDCQSSKWDKSKRIYTCFSDLFIQFKVYDLNGLLLPSCKRYYYLFFWQDKCPSHASVGASRAASSTSNIVKWNSLPWGNKKSHQVPLRSLWPAEIYNDHHLNTNMYFCVTLHFDQHSMFQSEIQHIKYYKYNKHMLHVLLGM